MSPSDLFRSMAKLLPEPMILVSGSGAILAANDAAVRLLRSFGEGPAGRSLFELIARDKEDARRFLEECLGSGQFLPGTFAVRGADGSLLELRAEGGRFQPLAPEPAAVVLRLRSKAAAVAPFALLDGQIERLNQEILLRRAAEREIRKINADLEVMVKARTAELEALNMELDSFASAVSHDLRAPLRGIISTAKILSESASARLLPEDLALLDRQNKAALRMRRLIDALLQMARFARAELRKQDIDLTHIAEEAIEAVAAELGETRTTFEVESGMRAHGDPDLIRFVLENLIGNAYKYSAPVERPRVEVGQVEIDSAEAGRETAFYVRDNGVGFDASRTHLLFVPFERLHDEREFSGTGVGLANVSRIVRRHGGRVWAEGAVGKGATFYFTLA